MSGAKADNIIRNLPFDGAYSTDTLGFAGGIWLLWRSDLVDVDVLSATEQEIHALIRVSSSSPWLLSAIYASPRFVDRCVLWDNLKLIADSHNLPWAVMGDFNEMISNDEKFGGNPVCRRRIHAYTECMDYCQLMDLGFSGPKFTWTNMRGVSDLIQERLDRGWVNPRWKALYPEASMQHLARLNSDHCPLLLNLDPPPPSAATRPFRFQPMWLNHSDFPRLVKEAWHGKELRLGDAISEFSSLAQTWNKEVFGNIFANKRRLLARLLGIQKALARHPSHHLLLLQDNLSIELNQILNLEEELWAIKARTNWLVSGERNTSYFHVSTLVRRSSNRINGIKDGAGNWIFDKAVLKDLFTSGYKSLYQTDQVLCELLPTPLFCWGVGLSAEESESLALPISDGEILHALNSMKPFKAPGPDGLHAGFFQRFWMVVGDSVKIAVKGIFDTGVMNPLLNQTLIALIPKQKGPDCFNHFRPISLCNTIYKIVSKLLVLRIKPFLPALISPFQTAFVTGRRGSDNVVIAQELIYSLGQKKGKMGFMVVKIDLEKAFDRLEWSFVRRVLIHFGFPPSIIKLILSCISSTSTSLLFNGGRLDSFFASRGLRQGDPLSPYLFVLCMEYLGALIDRECEEGNWTKLKASRGGPGFSHVFFADDLLLFAKANSKNCETIVKVLENFCSLSGQKVSQAKSRIFFSRNVSDRTKHNVCVRLGFPSTISLGKYLGFPIIHKGRSASDFHFLMEKIQAKLAG